METPRLLPTTVIGSYSLPKWLEEAREAHRAGQLTDAQIEEAHDAAIKSALKDQETAGVDIITDGELRRETMIYFFAGRIGGFRLYGPLRPIGTLDPAIRMPDPVVYEKVSRGDLGLAAHFRFAQGFSARKVKVCVTGPHMLAKRCTNEAYASDRDLVFDLAAVLNEELKEIAAAGCDFIQIDEPVWVGYPEEVKSWAVEAFNRTVEGVGAKIALHICYGNYQRKRLFPGEYRDLFPAVLEADASQLVLEFAVSDFADLKLLQEYPTDKEIGVGVIDVKSDEIETPETVASRIRTALKVIPPEKMYINPDCGLKFTPRDIAFAKLKAMAAGARIVREELGGL
ncbi:MAG: methionine synthase [Armatimonadetes bacterium]|nr:methionine synthase [Armatimonadota bacterium]